MEHTELTRQAPRSELMKLLSSHAEKRLIYIHAPAGYGKTVSAHLWLAITNANRGWLALDEYDNKIAEFCKRFVSALISLQPDNPALRELAAHTAFDTAPSEFAVRALGFFERNEQNYSLVLDDLHIIENIEILKLLPVLLKRLPQNFTTLLLSRALPPSSLSELVIKQEIAMVEAEHLRFTTDEIKALFESAGHRLTQKQADAVQASTGGWAIGLRALMLSGNEAFDIKLAGRHLAVFLKTHVWEKWDKRLRDFMMYISVAEELTPDLCQALIGEAASSDILARLVHENAFIRKTGNNTYRFHHLFRDFLLNMLEQEGESLKNKQLKKVGDWYYLQGDYYRAVEYFIKCKDHSGITKGLKRMYDYNSPYAAIEDTLSIIKQSVDGSIVDKHPFLLEVQTWAAYVEGRPDEMEGFLDRYYKQLPSIIIQNPKSMQTYFLVRCMDYRTGMVEYTKSIKKLHLKPSLQGKAGSPSLSQNMPFFHRGGRDFTEYVFDTDKNFQIFQSTLGKIVGKESATMEGCIRAGLLYEQGKTSAAYDVALSVNAALQDDFAAELKFCAMMIFSAVLAAGGQTGTAQKVLDDTSSMIERDKAFYLNTNFHAYKARLEMANGDKNSAQEWLQYYGMSLYEHLSFYKLYGHFTTARAHIVMGDYSTAILFLKKLRLLGESYRRPLDIIEANILLAIAYWKKDRGNQQDALVYLEQAIIMAHGYGYTQLFTNEGAELVGMLHRVQKRIVQKDYSGEVPGPFAKTLYIAALTESKRYKGLTGGRSPEKLTFTKQQKAVMRLMCEGCGRKEIAEKMGLKPSGVKSHMELIYRKLDVPGSVEAIIKIKELGVMDE